MPIYTKAWLSCNSLEIGTVNNRFIANWYSWYTFSICAETVIVLKDPIGYLNLSYR